ncbi:radical SAM protein [Burkholderia territorii]|uniref:radical SAM protein n=1 Tax=Burkholderia territorii TaxID=1503055 RepID=UPI0009C031E8|nr:radical SAM protein [Burkholderia territorii]
MIPPTCDTSTNNIIESAAAKPINYLLIKLSASCNIKCTYCYWFRDPSVLQGHPLLSEEVADALINRLREHFRKFNLKTFTVLFHGGEPLLFPKKRMLSLLRRIREVGSEFETTLHFAITTNGLLIDEEWCAIFRSFNISVTISFDGPTHDQRRLDKKGNGTASKVVDAINFSRAHGIPVGILAVCDPSQDGREFYRYMVSELGLDRFDVLLPDVNNDQFSPSLFEFYADLFDIWYDNFNHDEVEIRTFRAIIRGLFGLSPGVESLGYGVIATNTLLPDGSLEPLDVLRANGSGFTKTNCNIITNSLQDLTKDSQWLRVAHASVSLCQRCRDCEYAYACGGGYLPHRWSIANEFLNPSSHCNDLYRLFGHIWQRIIGDYKFILNEK